MKHVSTKTTTTVWVTKYALTRGIIRCEAEIVQGTYAKVIGFRGLFSQTEYRLSENAAISTANHMRANKIASLKKQIAKLSALPIKVTHVES